MKSTAPGQLLGYAMQFPRALCHLLKSGPGDVVCIECLGDVASVSQNGDVISEEDKSSIISNPLTDRSVDLWKAFANWTNAINSNELDIQKTKFVLYCNKSGRDGIVNKFSKASDQASAVSAMNEARALLSDLEATHEIWPHYDLVMNQNQQLMLLIIEKFDFQIGDGAGFDEVETEIRRKLVPESQIKSLLESLNGWLTKEVLERSAPL